MKPAEKWLSENDGVVLFSRKTESHILIKSIQEDAKTQIWFDIKNKLPNISEGVLVCSKYGITAAKRDYIEPTTEWRWIGHLFDGHDYDFHFSTEDVTHWTHLPQPPQ